MRPTQQEMSEQALSQVIFAAAHHTMNWQGFLMQKEGDEVVARYR
jgi:hypothetical protein